MIGALLTPSRFDSIEDGRGCDFSRSGAARYFCETCPAGRFKTQAAQKASCVDCAFPSTNFGGGAVCDACVSGYVNTVDNGTAVCTECPRGFLCHDVDVKREREVLKDLMKHQKRTLGRRLSSLGSRLGLKVAEEDVDVEGPASPLAAGRA